MNDEERRDKANISFNAAMTAFGYHEVMEDGVYVGYELVGSDDSMADSLAIALHHLRLVYQFAMANYTSGHSEAENIMAAQRFCKTVCSELQEITNFNVEQLTKGEASTLTAFSRTETQHE